MIYIRKVNSSLVSIEEKRHLIITLTLVWKWVPLIKKSTDACLSFDAWWFHKNSSICRIFSALKQDSWLSQLSFSLIHPILPWWRPWFVYALNRSVVCKVCLYPSPCLANCAAACIASSSACMTVECRRLRRSSFFLPLLSLYSPDLADLPSEIRLCTSSPIKSFLPRRLFLYPLSFHTPSAHLP